MRPLVLSTRVAVIRLNRHWRSRTIILLRTEVGTSLGDPFPPFILILSIHCLVLFGGHLPSFWALIASSDYSELWLLS